MIGVKGGTKITKMRRLLRFGKGGKKKKGVVPRLCYAVAVVYGWEKRLTAFRRHWEGGS